MIDSFSAWAEFQDEILAFHRSQLAAAQKTLNAAGDLLTAQEAARDASAAQLKAWNSWLKLWGIKR